MNHKGKLIRKFAYLILIFVVTTIVFTAFVTYFVQVKLYESMCKSRIMAVGDYLVGLIMEDPQDFVNYQNYYSKHFEELRIPVDFNDYTSARDEFFRVFHEVYPGMTYKVDVMPDELTEDLKRLYYTYRQEYWILTFEKSRESFELPYTYYLVPDEETDYTVYMIDGERTEDTKNPGYLYMGDSYYENPEDHELLWNTYLNGKRYDEVYEWNNEWGNTYSCYTPLVIDNKCLGLVVAEINVSDVKNMIQRSTGLLLFRLGILLVVLTAALLFFINKYHISRIKHLSGQIESFSTTRAYDTVDAIREYPYGNDEISMLASKTADMIRDLQIHEGKVAQAAQFKSDFIANMSHEIRTPMNAIVALSDMLIREELPQKAGEYAEQIRSSSNTMLVILNDILDFSNLEAGIMEVSPADYDVKKMITEVVNVTSLGLGDKPVVMRLNITPDIPQYLHGDMARIKQALGNVISNAVKFTKEGTIDINVGYEKTDDQKINLKFRVADTGIGIMKQDYDRIFESFSQIDSKRNREGEGTGLGLAITSRIIKLMSGTIEVESEYGLGSVFRISIPQDIARAETVTGADDKQDKEEPKGFSAPDARILVVDDNSVNLYVARNLLGFYDIKATCVLSGEQALNAVENKIYDLILMDYMMPQMDGIETTKRIRMEHPEYKDIPIIAFTANAVEEARDLLLKEMDDFISKPIKQTELEALLKKWLPENVQKNA